VNVLKRLYKTLLWIGFTIYLAILTKLILFKLPITLSYFISYLNELEQIGYGSTNIIPFHTIQEYLFQDNANISTRMKNIVGNIIGFIPFGFLLPLLSTKFSSFKKIFVATSCLSFTYEGAQFMFPIFGNFDIDDLILNTLGGILGYVTLKLFKRLIQKKTSHRGKNRLSN
jgi:glycopeptide antibiotics resistance protein